MILTPTQLQALMHLHRQGFLYATKDPYHRGAKVSDLSTGVLVRARLAVRDSNNRLETRAGSTWADGTGRWCAAVPVEVANQEDAAKAMIRGELRQRDALGKGVHIRVEHVVDLRPANGNTPALVWREK